MKFLTPLVSIVFFLCYSAAIFGQTPSTVIFELDQIFYDTTYNQFALPVSYSSNSVVSSLDVTFKFDETKIEINEVIVTPKGDFDNFSVNFDFPLPDGFQAAAYTPSGSQTTLPIMYILFDTLTSDALTPDLFRNMTSSINQAPANTQIISPDCTTIKDAFSDFEVYLLSTGCNDSTNNPIFTFEIVGDNSNMPYTIEAFSQSSTAQAFSNPNMLVGNSVFEIIFEGFLSPNGALFTFVIQNANGNNFIIEKPVYPCAAPDPCIASGGELTGEGKIITVGGSCPDFYAPAVQNIGLINCSGGEEKMYLLLNSFDKIEAASLTTHFANICGLKTEQYKTVHYIQCATNRPTPDIYGVFAMNQTNHPCPIAGINPYTDLVGGCKALSTTVRHKVLRVSQQAPTVGNNGYISCLNNNQSISNEFFENLSFSWSHDQTLNSCEATNLAFGEYDLTVTWNDAGLGFPIDTVFYFNLLPPVQFVVQANLGATYNEAVGAMTSDYVENQLLPYEQPFAQSPWFYDGSEMIFAIDNTVIDWVLIEVRNAEDSFHIVEQQAALLLDDGSVVRPENFDANMEFYNVLSNKAYHVSIKARNHVGAMTAQAYFLADNPMIDFRNAEIVLDGFNQLKLLPDETFGLRGGDFDGNGFVTIADLNIYLQQEGLINLYEAADANCDGVVTTADLGIYLENASHIGVAPIRY